MSREGDAREPWHDPELPFLDVLEQAVRRKAERATIRHEQRGHLSFSAGERRSGVSMPEAHAVPQGWRSPGPTGPSTAVPAASTTARRHDAMRRSGRVARRSLTLMALLCLIGASAYGASEVFSSSAPSPLGGKRGAFVLVASGKSGADRWKMRLYTRGSELCRVLSVAETEASDCASAPSAKQVEVTSAESPSHRYLFGVTGSGVGRVRIRLGHKTRVLSTRAPAHERSTGLPAQVRYFLAVVARPAGGANPQAMVEGLSTADRPLGKPVASCLETGEPGRC
jgi:hypothetical protein